MLLVEDEQLFRDVIRRFLHAADPSLRVDVAETLDAADTALRDTRYDVVLVDVRLPDGSGLDLASALTHSDHAPPVVVVTGVDDRQVWARSADIGAVVVLPKASLSAERMAGALAFAFEVTASQRASELTADAAAELSRGPDPEVLRDLLHRLCTALALDGASLTLSRDGESTTRVDVGSRARTPAYRVRSSRQGWDASLELHASDRRWAPVGPALAVFCDVTVSSWRLAATSAQLTDSERRCRAIADATADLIMTFDRDDRLLAANAAAVIALGGETGTAGPPVGRRLPDLLPALPALAVAAGLTAEIRRSGRPTTLVDQPVEADGLRRWYSGRALPGDPGPEAVAGSGAAGGPGAAARGSDVVHVVLSDCTARVLTEHELSTLALTDPLTGLANRRLAMDRLKHALEQLGRRNGALFVALLDIDFFKSINDLNGHGAGDEVIRSVARRLSAMARRADTCARLGGDEFLVVAEGVQGTEGGQLLATRIHEALTGGVTLPDRVLPISVSLGYTIVDDPTMTAEEALRRADEAAYVAKSGGRNQVAVYEGGSPLFDSGAALVQALHEAYESGRFRLRFQPLAAVSGRVVGAEALLRLDHDRYGEVTPEHFIETLLESPLVVPVGRLVVSSAVEQLAAWRTDGVVDQDFRMHVNVAPHQLGDSGFVDHLLTELARTGVPPSALALEITEQTLADVTRRSSALSRVAGAGIRLFLGDFGTGGSPITHLRSTTLSGIKIDRCFTEHLDSTPRDVEIVRGLIALGQHLDLDLVVEGVETPGHLTALTGCLAQVNRVALQGFHLGCPMTDTEFVEHVRGGPVDLTPTPVPGDEPAGCVPARTVDLTALDTDPGGG